MSLLVNKRSTGRRSLPGSKERVPVHLVRCANLSALLERVSRSFGMPRLLCLSVLAVSLTGRSVGEGSVPGSVTPAGNDEQVCQVAILRNGFTIKYRRHEAAGSATQLWLCGEAGAGYVEIPSDQIDAFQETKSLAPVAPETNVTGVLPGTQSIRNLIVRAALRYQIDPDFVTSVVKAESGFNPAAVSPKGATGLMQLMPRTAASLGVENVLDPVANVEGGTKYLRHLLDQYDGDAVRALAAYNAGPKRVEQYGGVPPYRETRAYVTRIIADYNRSRVPQPAQAGAMSAN